MFGRRSEDGHPEQSSLRAENGRDVPHRGGFGLLRAGQAVEDAVETNRVEGAVYGERFENVCISVPEGWIEVLTIDLRQTRRFVTMSSPWITTSGARPSIDHLRCCFT